MGHKLLEYRVGIVIAGRFKNLGAVLETTGKNSLRTQVDFGFVESHAGATVGLFEMGLVGRLPIKNQIAAFLPAKPLSLGAVEIRKMSL